MEFCQREFNFYIYSPGCRTNQCDGEMLAYILEKDNFKRVYNIEKANFLIISGCVVTDKAEKESLRFMKKAKKINPNIKIVLSGCLAEKELKEKISSSFCNFLIPQNLRFHISKILKEERTNGLNPKEDIFFAPVIKFGKKARFFFKIQEGCSQNCAYCYVREVRGKPRSLEKEKVIEHTKNLVKNNIKEIVFCGTHLGIYGKDFGYSLKDLIAEVEKMEGDFRFRLSSLEPWDLKDDLIETLKNSKKFCYFFHLPLQSGSDFILKKMSRPYSSEFYFDLILKLKRNFEFSRIGADLIVGFPGESEKEFKETLNFIKKIPLDYLHIFTYSPRPNYPVLPTEDRAIIKERYKTLKNLDKQLRERDKDERIGLVTEALTIGKEGILRENYYCIFKDNLKSSLLLPCKIVKWNDDKAIVEVLQKI